MRLFGIDSSLHTSNLFYCVRCGKDCKALLMYLETRTMLWSQPETVED